MRTAYCGGVSKSHLSAPSLRQTEAEARHDLLDVTSYDVRLDLASDAETFGSITTIHFESRGGPTFVDLKAVRVNDLRFNDAPLDLALVNEGRLPLDTVAGTNVLRVDAVMAFRNDGEGLHRSVDPADGRHYIYGMSFMDAAPSVFACFDQPDLKAPYTFHVTAPLDWTVIGNAPGEQVEPGTWEFADDPAAVDVLRHDRRRALPRAARRARRHPARAELPGQPRPASSTGTPTSCSR